MEWGGRMSENEYTENRWTSTALWNLRQLMKKLFIKHHKFYFVRSSLFTTLHVYAATAATAERGHRVYTSWNIIYDHFSLLWWKFSAKRIFLFPCKLRSQSLGMSQKPSYCSSDCVLLPCEVVQSSFVLKWKLKKKSLFEATSPTTLCVYICTALIKLSSVNITVALTATRRPLSSSRLCCCCCHCH